MLTNEQLVLSRQWFSSWSKNVITNEQLKKLQEITYEFIDMSRNITDSNDF